MYGRLGVPTDASPAEIGHAYRRLARSVHPDTHPDDPEATLRFREIAEAYEILGDPARRARYDGIRPSGESRLTPDAEPVAASRPERPSRLPTTPTEIAIVKLGGPASPPLLAGPVYVQPPASGNAALPSAAAEVDLGSFVDALLQPWRWRSW